ncbi:hypothetical protein PGTUg99_036955 [Puccinia graminis f. sp. tritici]|uniref:Uncharacterized protein n=2 Tax=Puccinia graminis f. sp. tritici TaxID=56615 RepID=H6QNV8_PUCGT|nr:uncharacterized protein PGTG_20601 [Puccinia graminis f. sp. tritici CRL 75-36-700-3]EHS62478.1 hypothetical protein PGTG_20601 [Puccinia graminis f. sp. tritici CRL 75-36-700-3]KAA1127463.1 hypothetical protein PGTUg99_036955 [Puccinia graminis f. sp. tritici]
MASEIALILNAGLKALRQSNDGLVESRGDTLGFAPDLAPIIEESEEREEPDQFVAEDVALEFRPHGQAESRTGSDGCNGDGDLDSSDIPDNGGSNIDTVLKKPSVPSTRRGAQNSTLMGSASLLGTVFAGTLSSKVDIEDIRLGKLSIN